MSQDIAGLSFEDALAELERIVKGLEGGQQKLEDAITAYERGAGVAPALRGQARRSRSPRAGDRAAGRWLARNPQLFLTPAPRQEYAAE